MPQATPTAARTSLWLILVCAGGVLAISLGLRQGFGLFLVPVSTSLGEGRGAFALGVGLMNLVWGLAAPAAGALADRHGARFVAAGGALVYVGGLVVMAYSGTGWHLAMAGLAIGLGLSGVGFTVVLGAVGRAAPPEKRGKALAFASFLGSLGQFLAIPYSEMLLGWLGWSVAFLALAGTAALMVPLAAGMASGPGRADDSGPPLSIGRVLSAALHDRSYLFLTTGFFVCGFHLAFVAVHLPGYLGDVGFSASLGAQALALIGLANIFGTYAFGLLGVRYRKKSVLAAMYLARGAIFAAFALLPLTRELVLVGAFGLGLLWLGTVPLTSGIVAALFGPANLSMLFGIVFLSHQLGGFFGTWLAGVFYDAFGNYDAMWWTSVALGVGSALLHMPIRESAAAPAAAPA